MLYTYEQVVMVLGVSITPVMYFDPTGEFAWVIAGAIIGGLAGAAISYYTTGSVDWRYVVGGALIGAGAGLLYEAVFAYYSTTTSFVVAGELGAGGVTAGSTGYDILNNSSVLTQEIVDINSTYGGFEYNGTVSSVVHSATYYSDPYDQVGAIMNGIVNNHLFFDGNKKTAFDTYFLLQERMNLSPKGVNEVWGVINDIGKGVIDYATEIASRLR